MATIDLIVLGMLKKEELSAYDIQKLVEYRNISKWVKVSTPSIYKKVLQLEQKGLVSSRTEKEGNMPEKAVYSLTENGETEFEKLMHELSKKPIHMFLDFNAVIENKDGVIFPVAPNLSEMSDTYLNFIEEIKAEIQKQRISVVLNANSSMICLYWNIGKAIIKKQEKEGWGTKVIDRMAKDLKDAFPDMSGFSPRNIKYMRKFAECWPDYEIVQRVVAQIPWRSNISLMDKLTDQKSRIWYAQKTIENGWSKTILDMQIESRLMERAGQSVNNFQAALPPTDSDLVNQVFKDPYLFDFLGTDIPRREVEIERQLTEHIQSFLLELGQGFAFVGRQVHLEVGGDDFYIDLLFYHLKLRCYVVIELKACDFEPGFISQLNMYQNAVNDILRHPDDKPTIGLLLVKGKNKTVVEYSLAGYQNPIGVAEWKNQIAKALPEELRSSLPSVEEIEKELE